MGAYLCMGAYCVVVVIKMGDYIHGVPIFYGCLVYSTFTKFMKMGSDMLIILILWLHVCVETELRHM